MKRVKTLSQRHVSLRHDFVFGCDISLDILVAFCLKRKLFVLLCISSENAINSALFLLQFFGCFFRLLRVNTVAVVAYALRLSLCCFCFDGVKLLFDVVLNIVDAVRKRLKPVAERVWDFLICYQVFRLLVDVAESFADGIAQAHESIFHLAYFADVAKDIIDTNSESLKPLDAMHQPAADGLQFKDSDISPGFY